MRDLLDFLRRGPRRLRLSRFPRNIVLPALVLPLLLLVTTTPARAQSQKQSQDQAPESLPYYLYDRGTGLPTSMFGTYIRKGDLLVYPFYEYYRNKDESYAPEDFGYKGTEDYKGEVVQHEYLMFLGYGITEDVAVELEAALYTTETFKKDPKDTSGVPDKIKESGLGDVESQIRWRWSRETATRPEFFSYFEVVYPLQKDKVLIGTQDWEFAPGIGAVKGFTWGTITARVAAEYAREDGSFDTGEAALEYLKRVSSSWRFMAALEGNPDEAEAIFEAQWFVKPDLFVKLNSGFGVTPAASDVAPEVGVMFVF